MKFTFSVAAKFLPTANSNQNTSKKSLHNFFSRLFQPAFIIACQNILSPPFFSPPCMSADVNCTIISTLNQFIVVNKRKIATNSKFGSDLSLELDTRQFIFHCHPADFKIISFFCGCKFSIDFTAFYQSDSE